jgi:hypothetical protein
MRRAANGYHRVTRTQEVAVLEATRRFFQRPMRQIVDAWDVAESVWEIDDPFLDAARTDVSPGSSLWD